MQSSQSIRTTSLMVVTAMLNAAFGASAPPAQSANRTDQPPAQQDARLKWWSEARFGLFIHWGLYSVVGCQWHGQNGRSAHMMYYLKIPLAEYATIANDFNPTQFNADEWVQIARNAGMKYMVITAKHHEGFAMYDSKASDYNIMAHTPWKRDPIKELKDACAKAGLKFGVYYSLGRDWQDPDVPTKDQYKENTWDFPDSSKKVFAKYFERKVVPQVRELMTQYHPAIMWFDTPGEVSKAESEELLRLIRSIDPNCIVNSRVGNNLGDYGVEEQKIPDAGNPKPWETCMTINGHWEYFIGDNNWKPAQTLVRNLVDIASKGGNFLLDVGPTDKGVIQQPAVDRLAQMGAWLKVNGESIYGTTVSPIGQPAWGRCTRKVQGNATKVYLHVFDWPKDGKLIVPGLRSAIAGAKLLAGGGKLDASRTPEGVTINVPAQASDPIDSVIVVEVSGTL